MESLRPTRLQSTHGSPAIEEWTPSRVELMSTSAPTTPHGTEGELKRRSPAVVGIRAHRCWSWDRGRYCVVSFSFFTRLPLAAESRAHRGQTRIESFCYRYTIFFYSHQCLSPTLPALPNLCHRHPTGTSFLEGDSVLHSATPVCLKSWLSSKTDIMHRIIRPCILVRNSRTVHRQFRVHAPHITI
jgi:hypothetical protein